MGEKKILTDGMIDEALDKIASRNIQYIDPLKMAAWSLERACAMVDNTVSVSTLKRAIDAGELEAIKAGKEISIEPAKFLVWFRRHTK